MHKHFPHKLKYAHFKHLVYLVGMLLLSQQVTAQVKIGDNPNTIKAASLVELESTNKGFVLPRVSLAGAVTNPAPLSTDILNGTLVFNTNAAFTAGTGLFMWNNGAWNAVTPSALSPTDFWNINGNMGTTSATNFLGTTDNKSLSFRTNNIRRVIIDSLGSVGIGSTDFSTTSREKLLVDAGTTTSNTLVNLKGSINDYLQLNVQNKSNGANASSDIVATADNGTDSTNYIDFGINSSAFAPGVENWGGPNDGYLYSNSRNLIIGTQASSADVIFLGGGGVIKNNAILRLDGSTRNVVVGRGDATNLPIGNIVRAPDGNTTATASADLTIQGGKSVRSGVTGGNLYLNGGLSPSTAGIIALSTAGTERMRVDAAGNVGIGTGAPAYKLHVLAATNPLYLAGVQATSTLAADSILTINAGVVKKTAYTSLTQDNGTNWKLTGNSGTTVGTNFLGTTDGQALMFKVNNQQAGYLDYTSNMNASFGYQALSNSTPGNSNAALGYQALNNNNGSNNTASGFQSLFTNTGSNNTANGYQALYANGNGGNNSAMGYGAMRNNTGSNNTASGNLSLNTNTGNSNTANGYQSLYNNTGGDNTAGGYQSMGSGTVNTGNNNTALGVQSLYANGSGNSNTALGKQAMYTNSGGSNTATGFQSLYNNTGGDNTATGYQAMGANTTNTGSNNTANGTQALYTNNAGTSNTALGKQSMFSNSGNSNTAGGFQALYNNSGGDNTVLGYQAMGSNITNTGNFNTALGVQSLLNNTNGGSYNTATGKQSLNTNNGNHNTATGFAAMYTNTGSYNSAFGYQALYDNINGGDYNTAFGYQTLQTNNNGSYNVASGFQAMAVNANSGSYNVASGRFALNSNSAGNYNIATGVEALKTNINGGSYNIASGNMAMYSNNGGNNNIAFGSEALRTIVNSSSNNIAMGYQSMYTNNGSTGNVAIGYQTIYNTFNSASYNTAVGYKALNGLSQGSNNTALGYLADVSANSINNATAIGYNAKVGTSNAVVIGSVADNTAVGIGTTTPANAKLHLVGTGAYGSTMPPLRLANLPATYNAATDSVLTINNTGIVNAVPFATLLASGGSSSFWSTTGNAGTNSGTNFLGTTDNTSLSFRTNNTRRMFIDSTGSVGIGSVNFDVANREKLLVDYGTTTSRTLATFRGDINDYLQMNLRNTNGGNSASTDYVATADNGDESNYFIDMGINGSGYSSTVDTWGGPNDGYLYANARNLVMGTQSSGSDIVFLVSGSSIKNNTAMRINGANGNIIVGRGDATNNPIGNTIRAANGNASAIAAADLTLQGGLALKSGLAGGNLILNGGSSATGTGGYITLNTTNLERMRITPAGNIGIGTNAPNNKLEINQGTSGNSGLRFTSLLSTNTATTGNGKFLSVNTTGDVVLTDGTGVLALGAPNSTGTANAATLTGNVLQLSPADATNPGIITTGTQTLAGAKTLTGSTAINNTYKLGANGTTYKNQISFTASYTAAVLFFGGTYNIDMPITGSNFPTSTRATVTVSPAGDLTSGVIIGYAYLTSTTNVRVRFLSTSLLSFNFTPGTFYITINEF